MFFFWWRAGSENLLDVMEVTVCWQQSDSWQKRREKQVWHQQCDWQKWNWVHLTVAVYAYRPLTRRDSSSCPVAGPPPGFLSSLWSQQPGIICIITKKKKIHSVSDWGINLRCGMKWPRQIDLSWSHFCASLSEYTKEVISTLTQTFYPPFTGLER